MTQMIADLIPALRRSLDMELPDSISFESLKEQLEEHINHLIQNDFQKLVSILYRIDVPEEKLKQMLQDYKDREASAIITDLIIERQQQKLKTRQEFNQPGSNISEEEKW